MEIFKLVGSIFVDTDKANKSIKKTDDNAKGLGERLLDGAKKAGEWGLGIATAAGAATAAVATGVGKMAKDSLDMYASYEQLRGGVETLFGVGGQTLEEYAASIGKTANEAMDEWLELTAGESFVLNNAEKAYQTAGLSMNQYMETVTGFSAALIQSLGGDTAKAAQVADQAIIDMADNANKMGTSIDSIQNAYNGFAKGNFTMLDNLKLGYGGTKTEMERLLEDATKLSGVEYDLESFADITEAIHVVQDNLGITGATAKEASSTIEGSVGAMKASWENFLTSMGNEDADIIDMVDNLIDSVLNVMSNISERIMIILPRLIEGFVSLLDAITPQIGPILEMLIPPLIDGAAQIIVYLVKELPTILKTLGTALLKALKDIFGPLLDYAKDIFAEKWEKIWTGIKDSVTNVFHGIVEIVKKPINAIIGLLNSAIDGFNKIKIPDWVPLVGGKGIDIPHIPELAEGGELNAAGTVLVGERAPELLTLPRGARVTPLDHPSVGSLGNEKLMEKMIGLLEEILEATKEDKQFMISGREFGRAVRTYA